MSQPIFAIFQGGGAKGVAHIGALKAIEDLRLELAGVAGTSAGALIATLAAIGYTADEILDADSPSKNLLATRGTSPPGVLGKPEWKALLRLQGGLPAAGIGLAISGVPGALPFAPLTSVTLLRLIANRGHLDATGVSRFVNDIVRDRLEDIRKRLNGPNPLPGRVTFRDLDPALPGILPLKLVATNLQTGAPEVFSYELTPYADVGDAVAASAAIPLVFRPRSIVGFEGPLFVDGGLVSNLPAWVFSEEKLEFERRHSGAPPIPVVGFTFAPTDEPSAQGGLPMLDRFGAYVRQLADAALSGSQGVSQRFIEDFIVVRLQSTLGVLDLGAALPKLLACLEAGRKSAAEQLAEALQTRPARVCAELQRAADDLAQAVMALSRGSRPSPPTLRAALAQPFGARSLRFTFTFNMAGDADDRLVMDRQSAGPAQAYASRNLVGLPLAAAAAAAAQAPLQTKYEAALRRGTVQSSLSAPIFSDVASYNISDPRQRPRPEGVLYFDADEDLSAAFRDATVQRLVVRQSAVLYEALR